MRDFVGRDPAFANLDEAAAFLRRTLPPLGIADAAGWRRLAELTYERGADQRWHARWDTRIAAVTVDAETPADMWPFFGALAHVPLMLVWGQASDLLSASTVARMRALRPDMRLVSLPGIGHAPTLNDPPTAAALDDFLRAVP